MSGDRLLDDVDHYLLTKFNLPIAYARRHGQHGEKAWLAHRWSLFTTYCLPSVLNQCAQEFKWVLYCWDGTPEPFRSQLDSLAEQHEQISIAYLGTTTSGEHFADQMRDHLVKPYLLTTRLDNDDAISRDYLSRVQRTVLKHLRYERSEEGARVWNFPIGYQYAGGRYYLRVDPNGPFVSMLEQLGNGHPKTILATSHRDTASTYPTMQIVTRPAWMQVIHGDNLLNRVEGVRAPVNPAPRFGVEASLAHDGFATTSRDLLRTAVMSVRRDFGAVVRRLRARRVRP